VAEWKNGWALGNEWEYWPLPNSKSKLEQTLANSR
jgi:hypothetical protein